MPTAPSHLLLFGRGPFFQKIKVQREGKKQSVWIFFAAFSGYWVLRGLNAIRNSEYIAQSNADYIASGREEFFEQRRSWREWNQTPSTNAATIEQAGKRDLIWGLLGLLVVTPFIFWID